jgi:hypothetical protein
VLASRRSLLEAAAAVAGREHEWDAPLRENVCHRICEHAAEVQVEDSYIDGSGWVSAQNGLY